MMKNEKKAIDGAVIYYWDALDASNAGWAYHVIVGGEHEADGLPHRRRAVSLETLVKSLRREYRSGTVEIPRTGWRVATDGNGYAVGSLAGSLAGR
jgi:hypothetical protein